MPAHPKPAKALPKPAGKSKPKGAPGVGAGARAAAVAAAAAAALEEEDDMYQLSGEDDGTRAEDWEHPLLEADRSVNHQPDTNSFEYE